LLIFAYHGFFYSKRYLSSMFLRFYKIFLADDYITVSVKEVKLAMQAAVDEAYKSPADYALGINPNGKPTVDEVIAHAVKTAKAGILGSKCLTILDPLLLRPFILKYIARLTVQNIAYSVKRGKADRADFTRLYIGQVDVRDSYLCRQFVERHFPIRHHAVKPQNNRHTARLTEWFHSHVEVRRRN